MKIFRCSVLILFVLLCSSCGTIKSLNHDNGEVEIKHSMVKTNCDKISQIYSGVRYDMCLLDSERKSSPPYIIDPLWLTSIDIVASAVADTIVLPYTAYQQVKNGDLVVEK